MDWMQVLVILLSIFGIFGSVLGLFFWNRSESRNDYRHIEALVSAIHAEIKDFHGRLCAIEERYRSGIFFEKPKKEGK